MRLTGIFTFIFYSAKYWSTKKKRVSNWLTFFQEFTVVMLSCCIIIAYPPCESYCFAANFTEKVNMNCRCLLPISPFRGRDGWLLNLKQFYFHLIVQISSNVKICEKWDWYVIWNIPWVYRWKQDFVLALKSLSLFFQVRLLLNLIPWTTIVQMTSNYEIL